MSIQSELTTLANSIRTKNFFPSSNKLTIADINKYMNRLELSIDETKNMLRDTDNFGLNTAWKNSLFAQVGRDSENSPLYTWRTPEQHAHYLSQEIKDAKYNTMYVWKFYARADQEGDRVHTELWGGGGSSNFTLTNQWKLCITSGLLTFTDKPKSIYFGSLATNKGNVSITLPVLTEYTPLGGGVL